LIQHIIESKKRKKIKSPGLIIAIADRYENVVERYRYDAYGNPYEGRFLHMPKNNPYGFTGQRFEAELRVYSFAYREYNPVSMRWLTVDPVKDGLNWYQYCGSDPVNYIDLWGLAKLIAKEGKAVFIVEKGDDLWSIIKEQNPSASDKEIISKINEIAYLNKLDNPDLIKPRQELIAPESVVPDITDDLFTKMREHSKDLRIQNPFYFKKKVQKGGEWDFKSQEGTIYDTTPLQYKEYLFNNEIVRYDVPGNIHYGYVGSATWYGTEEMLLKQAGYAQIKDNPGACWTGDDPVDMYYIKKGIELYEKDKEGKVEGGTECGK